MIPSTLSLRQASTVLFLLASLTLRSAASTLDVRADPCGPSEDDIAAAENAFFDGPTSDKSAGLGIEFETGDLIFTSAKCLNSDPDNTFDLKGRLVAGRQGTNWKLTADTLADEEGLLTAEYILDGTQIKIGTGAAAAAAGAASKDILSWDPSAASKPNTVTVDGDQVCKDWTIYKPFTGGNPSAFGFSTQATAPMPLEGIQNVLSTAANKKTSPLLPAQQPAGLQLVTKDFFQSAPNGISSNTVKDDVLGFFTILISYAKAARDFRTSSPKDIISIMPRTDFSTMFKQVSGGVGGDLYSLVKVLACYQYKDGAVSLDTAYCGGTVAAPVPNTKMDGQTFSVTSSKGQKGSTSVQDWVKSIAAGTSPDALSNIDILVDGQIGGLGQALENVVGSNRAVPLFEFRRLATSNPNNFVSSTTGIENEIIRLHGMYKNPARFVKRRNSNRNVDIKRRGSPAACVPSNAPSTTNGATSTTQPPSTITKPPTTMPSCYMQHEDPDQGINQAGCICGTMTLPLLTLSSVTLNDQSCSYTALPTSNVPNPITIGTSYYTSNCQACTLVGGIADHATCTSVAGCTASPTTSQTPTSGTGTGTANLPPPTGTSGAGFVVYLSNNSVPIGNADDANSGADLRKSIFTKLNALCPSGGHACDSKKTAEMDDIPTIASGKAAAENLVFTIQDSSYENTQALNKMLAATVATWEQAVKKSCKEEEYTYDADEDGNCDSKGPFKRDSMPSSIKSIEKRDPLVNPCEGCTLPGRVKPCKAKAVVCAAPDHITTVMVDSKGNPYGNHLDISLTYKVDEDTFDAFICELIIGGLTDLAEAVAPELLELEIPEEIAGELDFQAMCEDAIGQINFRRDLSASENRTMVGW